MKKILAILTSAVLAILVLNHVKAAGVPVNTTPPNMNTASASYSTNYGGSLTVNVGGYLGYFANTWDNACTGDPYATYQYPTSIETDTVPSRYVRITSGPAALVNQVITLNPISVGTNGTCSSGTVRSSYSGTGVFSYLGLAPGTYNIDLYVQDNTGGYTRTISFTVPQPPLSVSCSGSPSPAYTGTTVTWSATPSGGTGSYTNWSWTGTDGLSGTAASVTKVYSTPGTKNATVSVTSGTQTASGDCSMSSIQDTPINGAHDAYFGTQSMSTCIARGWANDPGASAQAINIRVKKGSSIVATGLANQYRSDLTGVCSGNGGNCSFSINLSTAIPANTNNLITVEGQDANSGAWSALPNTNQYLYCASTPPPTVNLYADQTSIPYNTATLLKWTSTDATSCSGVNFSTGNATNNTTGVSTGRLTASKTYQINCSGGGGSASDTQTITVGSPATINVSSNIASTWTLNYPDGRTLNTSSNVTYATYTDMPGTYSVIGASKPGYTLTYSPASGANTVAAGGNITLYLQYDPVPTASISASPTVVDYGGSATLTWSSTGGATSCTASASPANANWTGAKAASGTGTTGVLTTPTTFYVYCTGPGGNSTTQSVRVGVRPSVTFNTNFTAVPYNGGPTLTWSSILATSCTASASPANSMWTGAKALNNTSPGEVIAPLTTSTTFTLRCDNADGYTTRSIPVTVEGAPIPTLTFGTDATVPYNGSATLTWSSTDTTGCTASASPANANWSGAKNVNGPQTISNLTASTTFTLVCNGNYGPTPTKNVLITVGNPIGTINVTSNISSTWNITGPQASSGTGTSQTITNAPIGNYTIVPATKTGYYVTVSTNSVPNTSSGALTAGGTLNFVITYTQVTANMSADAGSVVSGGSTMVHWSSTNATTCVGANFSTGGATAGDFNTGSLTATQTYSVTCGNGSASATASVTVTVVSNGDPNALSCTPNSQTVVTGQTTNFSSSNGSGTYSWSAPSGSPSTGGDASTFSTTYATAGNYTVTVTRGTATAPCSVTVNNPAPDFTLSVGGGNITSKRFGTSTVTSLKISPVGGFNQNVTLTFNSVSPALSGAVYKFNPVTLTPAQFSSGSAFNVELPNPVAEGTYAITIYGTSADGTIIRSAVVNLVVSDSGGGAIPPYEEF